MDDVISSGASIGAGLALLRTAGVTPVAVAVVMAQGDTWRAGLDAAPPLHAVFATPLFRRAGAGWEALPGTAAHDVCLA